MSITKQTKLADLLSEYPWLKDELVKVNEKFKMINSPPGKMMMKKATIEDMSNKSGIDAEEIIKGITNLIESRK